MTIDFPMQEEFVCRQHEGLGWKKCNCEEKDFLVKDVREDFGTTMMFGGRGFANELRHNTRPTY